MTAAATTYRRDFALADTVSRHERLPDWRNGVYVGVSPYRRRFKALAEQADGLRPKWRELRDYMAPQCGRWLDGTLASGVLLYQKDYQPYDDSRIVNGEIRHIINTCVSGLKYSFTSVQKPWFLFSTLDQELADNALVRAWLDGTRDTVRDVLAGSNFYDATNRIYLESSVFGVGVATIDPDPKRKINVVPLTIGEYVLAEDAAGRVDTCYVRLEMTAKQLRDAFGPDNEGFSQAVHDCLDDPARLDERFGVIRAMQPIGTFGTPPVPVQEGWRYESAYFLESSDNEWSDGEEKTVLRWEWHRTMPFIAVRWQHAGTHPYGVSPGLESLPDQKMLQEMESNYADAVEREINPSVVADADTAKEIRRHGRLSPGSVLVETGTGNQGRGVRAAYQINPNYAEYRVNREVLINRIKNAFHYVRWVAMEQNERQMTAHEVDARLNEKLAQLAPIVESHHSEMFDPGLERVYFVCLHDLGLIMPPPEVMANREFRIEYEGDYSKSIKQIEISRTRQFTMDVLQTAGGLVNLSPGDATAVLRNVDFSKGVRFVGRQYDVDPTIIRDEAEVDQMAAAEAEQAKQAQQLQALTGTIDAAQKLSHTPVGQGSALDAVMGGEGMSNAL